MADEKLKSNSGLIEESGASVQALDNNAASASSYSVADEKLKSNSGLIEESGAKTTTLMVTTTESAKQETASEEVTDPLLDTDNENDLLVSAPDTVTDVLQACSASHSELFTHTVVEGESLWLIGNQYNVHYMDLVEMNVQLANRDIDLIYPEETFIVSHLKENQSDHLCHQVEEGESLWSIGLEYDVNYLDIVSINEMLNGRNIDLIFPGELFAIPIFNGR
ncbi:hypothetical protein VCRA2114E327_20598 [Vibrio crassostreae]|nr:hypothetical protein VCRA2114E327_20598 [Vibrio crassostreae]